MKYKMLALDIDGTLADKEAKVHKTTADLLKLAADKGVLITLATGRTYPSAKATASKLNICIPLVVYNGAQIRDMQNDGFIFSKHLTPDVSRRIISFCKERGLYMQSYEDDAIIVEKIVHETRIDPDLAFSPCKEIGDFACYDLEPPPKSMIVALPEKTIEIEKQLKELLGDDIRITRSKPYLTELIHPEVSKSKALKMLADKYGIKQKEVIAVGDNDNDIDMIRWAGLGAAVANGSQDIKNYAEYIAEGEYNTGVEEIIRKFLLSS